MESALLLCIAVTSAGKRNKVTAWLVVPTLYVAVGHKDLLSGWQLPFHPSAQSCMHRAAHNVSVGLLRVLLLWGVKTTDRHSTLHKLRRQLLLG